MPNLYAITGTNPDNFEADFSLMVSASSPQRAVDLWVDYHWPEDKTLPAGESPFCPFEPQMVIDQPPGADYMKIFRVKHDLFHEGVLRWHDDNECQIQGYILERRY